jgi:hypothetical protein
MKLFYVASASFFLFTLLSPQRRYTNSAHHPVQMTAPSRVMFLCSCLLMLLMPVLRFSCLTEIEDVVAVFIMLTTGSWMNETETGQQWPISLKVRYDDAHNLYSDPVK